MSAYLSVVAHAHRTRGNSPLEYAALALAVALLPGAAAFFLLLAFVGALWALAAAVADVAGSARDRLAAGLLSGRAALAGRLRQLAEVIEPAPLTAPLDNVPSWAPDACPACGEAGWDCRCTWSPVEVPAAVPGVPQEATQAAEPAAASAVAPEPADADVAPPEPVYLPLDGQVGEVEPEPLPEPQTMPAAAQVTEPAVEPADALARVTATVKARAEHFDEFQAVRAALEAHGSVRAAAKALGVAESTLRGRCKRLGLNTPRTKGQAKGRGQSGEAA
jgi:hypothetical protein